MPPCVQIAETTVIDDGMRHDVYRGLAQFYTSVGLSPQEAIERIRAIDARNPIDDPDYIGWVVTTAQERNAPATCPNPGLAAMCSSNICHLASDIQECPPKHVDFGNAPGETPQNDKRVHVPGVCESGSGATSASDDHSRKASNGTIDNKMSVSRLQFEDFHERLHRIKTLLRDVNRSGIVLQQSCSDTPIVADILSSTRPKDECELDADIRFRAARNALLLLTVILAIREVEMEARGMRPYGSASKPDELDQEESIASSVLNERRCFGTDLDNVAKFIGAVSSCWYDDYW